MKIGNKSSSGVKTTRKESNNAAWIATISSAQQFVRGVTLSVLFVAGSAAAQQSTGNADDVNDELSPEQLEEVIVTGTLIKRSDGHETPTPVSVLENDTLSNTTGLVGYSESA